MVGLSHGVLEVVSDYLHEEPEWRWIPSSVGRPAGPRLWSAPRRGLPRRLLLRLTEEANSEGLQVRPQVAGRPRRTAWASVERAPIPTVSVLQRSRPTLDERLHRCRSRSSKRGILARRRPNQSCVTTPSPCSGRSSRSAPFRLRADPGAECRRDCRRRPPRSARGDVRLVGRRGDSSSSTSRSGSTTDTGSTISRRPSRRALVFGLSTVVRTVASSRMRAWPPSYSPTGTRSNAWRAGPVETLVRSSAATTRPTYGLDDRGTSRKEGLADVNSSTSPRSDSIAHMPCTTPGRRRRLVQRVDGYLQVIKSGYRSWWTCRHRCPSGPTDPVGDDPRPCMVPTSSPPRPVVLVHDLGALCSRRHCRAGRSPGPFAQLWRLHPGVGDIIRHRPATGGPAHVTRRKLPAPSPPSRHARLGGRRVRSSRRAGHTAHSWRGPTRRKHVYSAVPMP